MSGLLLEPLSQVPWLYVLCILFVSAVVIMYHSKRSGLDGHREILVLGRGVLYVIIFSLMVFSTTIFLKYASYLKIDVMQLSAFEFFVVVIIATVVIAWKSLLDDIKLSDVGFFKYLLAIPYLLRQVVLLFFMFVVVGVYNDELGFFEMLIAILPVNILYHIYRISILDKVFVRAIDGLDRVDKIFDAVLGRHVSGDGRGAVRKKVLNKKKGGNKL